MFKNSVITILLGLFMATTALAQIDGGDIPWKTDPASAMEEAKEKGLAMMLYFTSEG